MDEDVHIAKMRAQRESWLELDDPPRRAVKIRRLGEWGIAPYLVERGGRHRIPEALAEAVVDWRNFTEADLYGAGIGGDSPVPFTSAIFGEYLVDHAEVMVEAWTTLLKAQTEYSTKRGVAAKNSRRS